jgi:hypothetical protein
MPEINKNFLEDFINTRMKLFFESVLFDRIDFLGGVQARINSLVDLGLSEDAIVKDLFNELMTKNGTMSKLEKKESDELWGLLKTVSQYTVYSVFDDDTIYVWTLNPGAAHCSGCLDRAGEGMKWSAWKARGLPGTCKCHDNCMCYFEERKKAA